jgi:hypothetical protein
MEGEHLDRLADDIEANGLHEPIVTADIDGVTTLIDGPISARKRHRETISSLLFKTSQARWNDGAGTSSSTPTGNYLAEGQRVGRQDRSRVYWRRGLVYSNGK